MSAEEFARQLLLQDRFAVSKAMRILERWPKITLNRHRIAYYHRKQREFVLAVVFDSDQQRDEVLVVCAKAIRRLAAEVGTKGSLAVLSPDRGPLEAVATP
jgi:hypothetical protein